MKPIVLCILMIAVLISTGCDKETLSSKKFDGTFTGQFSLTNNNPSVDFMPLYGDVTVEFSGSNYHSTGNTNYVPAGGQGKYVIKTEKVIFTDTSMHTANFD